MNYDDALWVYQPSTNIKSQTTIKGVSYMRRNSDATNTTATTTAPCGPGALPSIYDVLETRLRMAILESIHPPPPHQQAPLQPYHAPHCTIRSPSVSHECLYNEAVMVRVFELMRLHPQALLALRQVCKQWYEIAQSELLWWQYREQILAGSLRKELRLYPSLVDGTASMPPLKTAVLFVYANATRTSRVLTSRLSTLRSLAKHTRYPILQPQQNALLMDVVVRKRHEISRRKTEIRKKACFKIGMPAFDHPSIDDDDDDDVVWDESSSSSDTDDHGPSPKQQRKRAAASHSAHQPSIKKQRQPLHAPTPYPPRPAPPQPTATMLAASTVSAPASAPAPAPPHVPSFSLAAYRYEGGILKSTVAGGDDLVIVDYSTNIPLARRRTLAPASGAQQEPPLPPASPPPPSSSAPSSHPVV